MEKDRLVVVEVRTKNVVANEIGGVMSRITKIEKDFEEVRRQKENQGSVKMADLDEKFVKERKSTEWSMMKVIGKKYSHEG